MTFRNCLTLGTRYGFQSAVDSAIMTSEAHLRDCVRAKGGHLDTALSSRISRAIATFLNFCVSHGRAMRFLTKWREILYWFYRQFISVSNSEKLFEIIKSVNNIDEVVAKCWAPRFLKHSVHIRIRLHLWFSRFSVFLRPATQTHRQTHWQRPVKQYRLSTAQLART